MTTEEASLCVFGLIVTAFVVEFTKVTFALLADQEYVGLATFSTVAVTTIPSVLVVYNVIAVLSKVTVFLLI